jgi:hypothetical protein
MKTQLISLTLAIVLVCPSASAQWVQTNAPSGGRVLCFVSAGTNLFAGTGGGVFLSTNNGTNWTAVNSGLTTTAVVSLAVNGSNLFAGTSSGGVFLSTNNGSTWTALSPGWTIPVNALVVSGQNLFAGTTGGVVLSTDNGINWTAANSGLTSTNVQTLTVLGANLLAGTSGGVFVSTNNGSSWTAFSPGWTTRVRALAAFGTNLFVGTSDITGGGFYRSTDNGASWSMLVEGQMVGHAISSLALAGTNLFAGLPAYGRNPNNGWGVYQSTDSGATWAAANTGLADKDVSALLVSGTNLFAGTSGTGVWMRPLSEMVTSVDITSGESPREHSLHQNYPNPFNPSTTIRYGLPNRSHVTLSVLNTLGQQVKLLQDGEQEAGFHEVKFQGSALSSGVYFYRLRAGDFVETKRLLLLR